MDKWVMKEYTSRKCGALLCRKWTRQFRAFLADVPYFLAVYEGRITNKVNALHDT
jgi:hypothetical protein